MEFRCDQRDATYPVRMSLTNHKRPNHSFVKHLKYAHCLYSTTKKDHLDQHVRTIHEKIKVTCGTCNNEFSDKPTLNKKEGY